MFIDEFSDKRIDRRLVLALDIDLDLDAYKKYIRIFNNDISIFKLNTAIFESKGKYGLFDLYHLIQYLKELNKYIILDCKRSEIDVMMKRYCESFIEMGVDAVTISPYMGTKSLDILSEYKDKFFSFIVGMGTPNDIYIPYATYKDKRIIDILIEYCNTNDHGIVYGKFDTKLESIPVPILMPGFITQGLALQDLSNYKGNYIFPVIGRYLLDKDMDKISIKLRDIINILSNL